MLRMKLSVASHRLLRIQTVINVVRVFIVNIALPIWNHQISGQGVHSNRKHPGQVQGKCRRHHIDRCRKIRLVIDAAKRCDVA